jgi:hypothetical protein
MTGAQPLPENMGAVIYMGWPPFTNWIYLGYLSNKKPSAIFKVQPPKEENPVGGGYMFHQNMQVGQNISAQIGIQLMDLTAIQHQYNVNKEEDASTITTKANEFVNFSQKMLLNFFNYASSFATDVMNNVTGKAEKIIPASVLDKWYQNFESKLKRDPYFWKN